MTLTPEQLTERTLHRRAVEAAIWGMPAVNFDAMYQALVGDAKGAANQIVYWSRLLDWRNQTLTPNPDAVYVMPFYDTTNGPVVLEIPSADDGSITGSIDDAWQLAIADVGLAGVDEGKGGRYLILPPDYQDPVPAGYYPMYSPTYCGYALLRSNLQGGSDSDIAKAVAYGKRVRFHPLADGDEAPTTFVDAADVLFDAASTALSHPSSKRPGGCPTSNGCAVDESYGGCMSSRGVSGGVVHELPADLRDALKGNDTALAAWNDITPLARNEFICWVEDAKQKATRERRIRRTQEELEEGKRRPCCWPGCKHRERTGS